MGRLWIRIALLGALGTVLTTVFAIAIQDYYASRAVQQLPASLHDTIDHLQSTPGLSPGERSTVWREAMGRVTDNEWEFQQFTRALLTSLELNRRVPRIAARISLPIIVLLSIVAAWFVSRPIREVSQAATRVTRGDLSARAPVRHRPGSMNELARLTRDFNTMAETLERLEDERRNLIADIAHELRTPLTILQGQIDAIRDGVRPLTDTSLEGLDRQTQLLARLVQDLRTLSLAEAGRLSLDPRSFDAARFTARVASSFADRAALQGVHLTHRVPDREIPLTADKNRLEQVLDNLLENALRYTPQGGTVEVNLAEAAGSVVFGVRDSGPGLSDDELETVFDRFYRAKQSKETLAGGSGLGLAIAKAIVELHGGSISARNAFQGGAAFEVTLPREEMPGIVSNLISNRPV